MVPAQPVAPILRWAGSKRKLLYRLRPYWGTGYERYVEPFMGSAALFFALQPPSGLLSDVNAELVATLKTIRSRPEEVYDSLKRIPEGSQSYYTLRAAVPSGLSATERASRFVFLNRFCFNGLYRTNRSGQFNVPYAPTKTGRLPEWDAFKRAADVLQKAKIVCADFETVVTENVRSGDFVYLDPPYAVGNRRVFRQYDPNSFGLEDLERLAELLKIIDARGAAFLLSYAYCKEALEAFKGWDRHKVFLQRNISGFAKHRRVAAELIVSNVPQPA